MVENVEVNLFSIRTQPRQEEFERELTCLAQPLMFVDLIIFPTCTDFNLCVCVGVCLSVGTLNTLISKMSCKSADHQLCKSVHR